MLLFWIVALAIGVLITELLGGTVISLVVGIVVAVTVKILLTKFLGPKLPPPRRRTNGRRG